MRSSPDSGNRCAAQHKEADYFYFLSVCFRQNVTKRDSILLLYMLYQQTVFPDSDSCFLLLSGCYTDKTQTRPHRELDKTQKETGRKSGR